MDKKVKTPDPGVWKITGGIPADSSIRMRAEVRNGDAFLIFKEFAWSRASVECTIVLHLTIQSRSPSSWEQRIDMRSASARASLATALNGAYGNKGEGFNWMLILNNAFRIAIEELQRRNRPVDVSERPYQEPEFLLSPFLQARSSNLLFAQSEAGKTWLALYMAACLALKESFLGFLPSTQSKVLFLDYEDDEATFASRLHKIANGMGRPYKEISKRIFYYKPAGSLRMNLEILKSMISENAFDLVIIDAGGDAAGGSPSDEEKVLDLFNALEELRVTKLILHHEPKYVVSEQAAFYGSMYWRARSRVAWRLEVDSENGSEKLIKATLQKRSNLPYYSPIYYKMDFSALSFDSFLEAGVSTTSPMVKFSISEPKDTIESLGTPESIKAMLEEYPEGLTLIQLTEKCGKDKSVISKACRLLRLSNDLVENRVGRSFIWKLKKYHEK